MERDPKSYNVRAVERAVRILSSFDSEHAEQGVSEIAQSTGLHKATAHRIIIRDCAPLLFRETRHYIQYT